MEPRSRREPYNVVFWLGEKPVTKLGELCRITNVRYGPMGTSPDTSKANGDRARQRWLLASPTTQGLMHA